MTCNLTAPVLERLSNELEAPIYVLDMNANPSAWERFGITGTPTVVRYTRGSEVERMMGGYPDDEWRQLLQRYKDAATEEG